MDQDIKVKSLYKALNILDLFIADKELGVTEISDALGLYKSNVHSILDTFRKCGYLEKNDQTERYRLGLKIFELSKSLGDSFDIRQISLPFMQEISNEIKERVYLAIPNEDEVLYLEATYPAGEFSLMRTIIGERAKMYCTGIGKAMLANLPDDIKNEYISRELIPFTENTITDQAVLLKELDKIKRQGYAVDNMEHEYGVKCVAVPLLDKYGRLCGGLSASGPSLRFKNGRIQEIANILKNHAAMIENRL